MTETGQTNQDDLTTSENIRHQQEILSDTLVLLDYLGRQGDRLLQAQFDDTRGKLPAGISPSAVPPCSSYDGFLTRLARIQRVPLGTVASGQSRDENLSLDDLSFLRWSRDFLAAVAAPATVQSIELTQEYTRTRAQLALPSRWLPRLMVWFKTGVRSPGDGTEVSGMGGGIRKPTTDLMNIAQWLAKCVRNLEYRMLLFTILTLILSTYAMAGRFIIDQDKQALSDFLAINKTVEANEVSLVQEAGWQGVRVLAQDDGDAVACLHVDGAAKDQPVPQVAAATRQASTSADPVAVTSDLNTAERRVVVAAMGLLATCRRWQWDLMKMVSENVRLKSWDSIFIDPPLVGRVIGWNETTVHEVGSVVGEGFCHSVARAYGEIDPEGLSSTDRQRACTEVVRLLVQDSASMAAAILGCITLYMLPCLYAYLGAAAATMFELRRKTDRSQLNYTDRGLITYNERLGVVFGAVIGLFASYVTKTSETNGLGLSALALLAGYNVPGVFSFLDELSNRVFRPAGTPASQQ